MGIIVLSAVLVMFTTSNDFLVMFGIYIVDVIIVEMSNPLIMKHVSYYIIDQHAFGKKTWRMSRRM